MLCGGQPAGGAPVDLPRYIETVILRVLAFAISINQLLHQTQILSVSPSEIYLANAPKVV